MTEDLDDKIEEIIEKKVEEKLEKEEREQIEDSKLDKKIEEKIAEKIQEKEKEEKKSVLSNLENDKLSRRSFLKAIGLGAGGLALSSTAAANWINLTDSSGGGGFTYVQNSSPSNPSEGDTWYDTDGNSSYVYNGSSWIEQTVTDHSQLSGINSNDHHSRYTDNEARNALVGRNIEFREQGSSIDTPTDENNNTNDPSSEGIRVQPSTDIAAFEITLSENTSEVTSIFVTDTNQNIIDEITGGPWSSGHTETLSGNFQSGNEYWIGGWNPNGNMDPGWSRPSFPLTSSDFDIVEGVESAHPDDGNSPYTTPGEVFCIGYITAYKDSVPHNGTIHRVF